jgi:hypothetical protein
MTTGLPVSDATQRCLDVVEELARRWHKIEAERGSVIDLVKIGKQIEGAKAISLILGLEWKAVNAALEEGSL